MAYFTSSKLPSTCMKLDKLKFNERQDLLVFGEEDFPSFIREAEITLKTSLIIGLPYIVCCENDLYDQKFIESLPNGYRYNMLSVISEATDTYNKIHHGDINFVYLGNEESILMLKMMFF